VLFCQIKAHLRGSPLPYTAEALDSLLAQSGARNRELMAAERQTEAYWLAEFFRQARVANPQMSWRAELVAWAFQDGGTVSQPHNCCT